MSRPEVRQAIGDPDHEDKVSDKLENWSYAVDGDICNLEFVSGILIHPPRCTSEAQRAWIRELAQIRDDANALERAQAVEQREHNADVAKREEERLQSMPPAEPPPPPVVPPPPHVSKYPNQECYFVWSTAACNVDYKPRH